MCCVLLHVVTSLEWRFTVFRAYRENAFTEREDVYVECVCVHVYRIYIPPPSAPRNNHLPCFLSVFCRLTFIDRCIRRHSEAV